MKLKVSFLLMSLCLGCTSLAQIPEHPEQTQFTVKVVLYDHVNTLNTAFEEHGGTKTYGEKAHGFTLVKRGYCELHLLKLQRTSGSVMEDWGHELSHCVYGEWHS